MPIPKPHKDEDNKKFISRCMSDPTMNKDYKDSSQRYAVCVSQTKGSISDKTGQILAERLTYDYDEQEDILHDDMIVPDSNDYVDFGEEEEDYDLGSKYEYKHPVTNEVYLYDRRGVYEKDGRTLLYVGKSAEHQGRTVKLNKPFRTPNGPKKFAVYVKNDKGKVVIVRFGDPNMKIKKNIPERRRSFRARHNCDNPGPKWKARYWACKSW